MIPSGSLPEVFGFVAQTLSQKGIILDYYFLFWDKGRNHVNKTTRHGIVAHRFWEENLGNVTEVIVTDSFGFVARSLWFRCRNTISERNNFGLLFSLLG